MKKSLILLLSILALLLTFTIADLFSIYHFGSTPTLLTTLYLISIFAIFEYLLILINFIIRKLLKKDKLEIKKIIALILLFIALLLVLLFLIVVDIDYLNWHAYSSPFHLNVIARSVEFLLPSIILIVISVILIKRKQSKNRVRIKK